MKEKNNTVSTPDNENTSGVEPKKAEVGIGTILLFLAVLIAFTIFIGQKVTGEPFFKVELYDPEKHSVYEGTVPDDDATFIGDSPFYVAPYPYDE